MIAGSLFSGVGGMDLGLARAGFTHAFFAESDPWRRDVIAAHWPGTTIYDDVRGVAPIRAGEDTPTRRLDRRELERAADRERAQRADGDEGAALDLCYDAVRDVGAADRGDARQETAGTEPRGDVRLDLLCGGFPCQDLSVAGRRAGLAGARSGLFHEFARIADALRPTWLLVENVPGLLSSNDGRDFGVVLGTLAELGYGIAWRVLDARYFGVAQRRRRVFLVGHSGGDAALALRALCESCDGDPTPRDCSWTRPPSLARGGAEVARTLMANERWDGDTETFVVNSLRSGGGWDDNQAQAGHMVVAGTLDRRRGGADENEAADGQLIVVSALQAAGGERGHRIDAEGAAGGHLVTFHQTQDPISEHDATPALGRTSIGMGLSAPAGVRRLTPIECERLMSWPEVLTLYGESDEHIRGSVQSCRAEASAEIRSCDGLLGLWSFGREDGASPPGHPEPSRGGRRALLALPREAQPETCPASGLRRVRFYLPTEAAKACAMLLGSVHRGEQPSFGDPSLGVHASLSGWTAPDGVKAPDSRRYAACGDGVVANVAEWIARGIQAV